MYKPVLSGYTTELAACAVDQVSTTHDDDMVLWLASGRFGELERVCPQRFRAPLAPSLAARAEGRSVDARLLRRGAEYWRQNSDIVLVEGAGGLMSPLTDDEYVADLALDFGYPLVVVTANCLGAINQTLQTIITAGTYRGGLPVAAVVLNHALSASEPDGSVLARETNFQELRARLEVNLTNLAQGAREFSPELDWYGLALSGITRDGTDRTNRTYGNK
jgi:dethiobiotin synthetase